MAGLALVPAALASTGCGGSTEQPAPKKLERDTPFERGKPKVERDPNDPLRNPATETPRGRDGDQIGDEEIDAVLAEAAAHEKAGDIPQARTALRKCANKTPASARCDGRMGLTMAEAKNWRATAQYYLVEAAKVDDPKADAAFYLEVGEALQRHGRVDEAILALEKSVARDPAAGHLFALGRALSLSPDRLPEAADRIAEARAAEDNIEWLYEEAVLRGQIPVREQAAKAVALFNDYLARAETLPAEKLPVPTTNLPGRIAELEGMTKVYPTQAEYDAQAANAPAEPSPAGTPVDSGADAPAPN